MSTKYSLYQPNLGEDQYTRLFHIDCWSLTVAISNVQGNRRRMRNVCSLLRIRWKLDGIATFRLVSDLPAAVRSDSVLLSKHQSLVVQFLVQYVNPQKGEREAGATRNAQRVENQWTYYAARSAWSSYVDDDMLKVSVSQLYAPLQMSSVSNKTF